MRLYIITANWGKGGPGGIAGDLYNTAIENGWECRFAYARESIPSSVNSYHIGVKITPYMHAFSSMVFDNAGFATKKSTLKLIEDIKMFNPDIINLHNPLGYSMNVGILFEYFKKSEIPVVWTLHDIWSITGHCITGLCENWEIGCGNCPNKKEYPASYVFDRSRRNRIRKQNCFSNVPNLYLVSPSYWLKDLVSTTYLNQYRIDVIHNGIDLDVFKSTDSNLRIKYRLDGKKILLAVAAVWTKNKGAEYIYKLSNIMDDSYAFVMIGENKDEQLATNKRIIHIPRTNEREELVQWYSISNVFINPTMGDNFPTVNIEALACGTPVVTFNTGGSGEAIGECGYVSEQGNVKDFIHGIEHSLMIRSPKEKCRKQAEKFSKNIFYKKYEYVFIQAIEER